MTHLPAITVWQPWATLIAIGAKPFEFRGWRAPAAYVGKRIAIHAGARPMRRSEVSELVQRLSGPEARLTGLTADAFKPLLVAMESFAKSPDTLWNTPAGIAFPLSHIVCTAVLGEPIDGFKAVESIGARVNDSDRNEHANWGWPMLDAQQLQPPVPAKGAQGFWRWSA